MTLPTDSLLAARFRVTGDPPAGITAEYLERAINATAEDYPLDDLALLFLSRGTLLGHDLTGEYLVQMLSLTQNRDAAAVLALVVESLVDREAIEVLL